MTAFGRRPGVAPQRILAISSSGGHWTELLRLAPALEGHTITWTTTDSGYRSSCPRGQFRAIRDASRWDKAGLLVMLGQIVKLMAEVRPAVVLSTGAAPGYFALRLGKLLGAKTIWVDSIANADELSLSGRRVRRHCDLYLTQWKHLARPSGPLYQGSLL